MMSGQVVKPPRSSVQLHRNPAKGRNHRGAAVADGSTAYDEEAFVQATQLCQQDQQIGRLFHVGATQRARAQPLPLAVGRVRAAMQTRHARLSRRAAT